MPRPLLLLVFHARFELLSVVSVLISHVLPTCIQSGALCAGFSQQPKAALAVCVIRLAVWGEAFVGIKLPVGSNINLQVNMGHPSSPCLS